MKIKTTTIRIKYESKYFSVSKYFSEGNTCIAELRLEVLPLT